MKREAAKAEILIFTLLVLQPEISQEDCCRNL